MSRSQVALVVLVSSPSSHRHSQAVKGLDFVWNKYKSHQVGNASFSDAQRI